jgi:hypothetical protein
VAQQKKKKPQSEESQMEMADQVDRQTLLSDQVAT